MPRRCACYVIRAAGHCTMASWRRHRRWSRKTGGYIRKDDLAEYKPQWVEPIHTNYRGYDVWEIPPNGHGLVVLMA